MAAARWGRNRRSLGRLLVAALSAASIVAPAQSYDLDPDSQDSIKSIAKDMTADMMSFYTGNQPGQTPGLLPQPYYWWEAGAMMGALIDYWYYTGDTSWNDITTQGLLFQVGPYNDYMPPNQTLTEGNDDQGFWGLSVMTAAEYNYPNPPADKPQWLALAQAVFNTQAARWDAADCNGGLRWQIFNWNNGFDYKNSISQACFFSLSARLARYTGNSSYSDWADKTWDWMVAVKFIDDNYMVYDGAHIGDNCTKITPYQWTYNAGAFILGAAAMWNYTEDVIWKNRLEGLLKGAQVFFTGTNNSIMTEVACEPVHLCDLDQQSFKAYMSRWLAATTKWAPFTTDTIMPWIRASSVAAASQCKGGSNGRMCGLVWNKDGEYDGTTGVGQQMAAMEVVLANMVGQSGAPITHDTGGTSVGDPGAGGSDIGRKDPPPAFGPVSAGDKVGGVILTLMLLALLVATFVFMMADETSDETVRQQFNGFSRDVKRGLLGGPGLAAGLLRKHRRGGADGANGGVLGEKGFAEKGLGESGSESGSFRGPVAAAAAGRLSKPARTARPGSDGAVLSTARQSVWERSRGAERHSLGPEMLGRAGWGPRVPGHRVTASLPTNEPAGAFMDLTNAGGADKRRSTHARSGSSGRVRSGSASASGRVRSGSTSGGGRVRSGSASGAGRVRSGSTSNSGKLSRASTGWNGDASGWAPPLPGPELDFGLRSEGSGSQQRRQSGVRPPVAGQEIKRKSLRKAPPSG